MAVQNSYMSLPEAQKELKIRKEEQLWVILERIYNFTENKEI